MNTTYAESARALGMDPVNPTDTYNTVDFLWGGSSGCRDYDNNYIKDLTQLKSYGMLKDNMDVWLASRYYDASYENNSGYHRWSVRAFSASGNEDNKMIFEQIYNGGEQDSPESAGVRPVIKLRDNIKVVSGEGTISNPYVISL